ncbi:homeodomain-interacting protein kinase 1-like [Cheilinus undulatus]|uniref:homeodomain-interacting protein kinase 1-like n=1 Tax=Cheilinus undulatus TaxID=241271 RepID=UPI001BD6203C|nr:homeodomain-interacting protein kinase 1-like [Cheilinus undulatus]
MPKELKLGHFLYGKSIYSILEFIGEGCFGKVAKCRNMATKKFVAIKILKQHLDLCLDTKREMKMLEVISALDTDRSNVVKFFECFEENDQTCLAFEMLDKSLYDLMKANRFKPMSLQEIRPIAQQVLVALNALKGVGVIHGDIKPDNIMLVDHQNQPFKIKLIDFGQAVKVTEAMPWETIQPIGYRAPEVVLGLPFDEAIDVWGVACVLAFMYLRNNLFPIHCEYQMAIANFQVKLGARSNTVDGSCNGNGRDLGEKVMEDLCHIIRTPVVFTQSPPLKKENVPFSHLV